MITFKELYKLNIDMRHYHNAYIEINGGFPDAKHDNGNIGVMVTKYKSCNVECFSLAYDGHWAIYLEEE